MRTGYVSAAVAIVLCSFTAMAMTQNVATTAPVSGPAEPFRQMLKSMEAGDIDAVMRCFADQDDVEARKELTKLMLRHQSGESRLVVLDEHALGDVGYVITDTIKPNRTRPKIEAGAAVLLDGQWKLIMRIDRTTLPADQKERANDAQRKGIVRAREMSGKTDKAPTTQPDH